MAETAKKVVEEEVEENESLARAFDHWDSKVLKAQKSLGGSYWDLGEALIQIRDQELWKALEVDSFTAYLESREVSRSTSYNCIRVAEKLSREKAIELGRSVSYQVSTCETEKQMNKAIKILSRKHMKRKVKAKTAKKVVDKVKGKKSKADNGKPVATTQLRIIDGRGQIKDVQVPVRKNAIENVEPPKGKKKDVEKTYAVRAGQTGLAKLHTVKEEDQKEIGEEYGLVALVKISTMTIRVALNDKKQIKVTII